MCALSLLCSYSLRLGNPCRLPNIALNITRWQVPLGMVTDRIQQAGIMSDTWGNVIVRTSTMRFSDVTVSIINEMEVIFFK